MERGGDGKDLVLLGASSVFHRSLLSNQLNNGSTIKAPLRVLRCRQSIICRLEWKRHHRFGREVLVGRGEHGAQLVT